METTGTITPESGRSVALRRLAQRNGQKTIMFCHPAPGAGNLDPVPEETARRSVTLLFIDRPGYGESEMVQGDTWATISSAADDIAKILQKINIKSVGGVGWSARGRVALVLAARHPDLIGRLVIIATPALNEAVPWIPAEQKQSVESLRGLAPLVLPMWKQVLSHLAPGSG